MMTQSQRTILIIDDFPPDRELYRRYLNGDRDVAYQILEAESAEDGLLICQVQQLDGILLDFGLPGADGLQFLVKLRACIGDNCPPVVMVSGRGSEAVAVSAIKNGAEDYLVKGQITPVGLQDTLRTAIENAELRLALGRTERALRQSEERYRAVVEDQTELICRYLPDGTLTFVNEAYSRYFGSTSAALMGQNFLQLIPEAERESVRQQMDRLNALTPEQPILTQAHSVLKPNGEVGWQQWTDRAIFNAEGEIVEFQAVGRDISDLKQAEVDLRHSEARLKRLVDLNLLGIEFWDADGTVLDANDAFLNMIGYTREDLQAGRINWRALTPPEQLQYSDASIEKMRSAMSDTLEKEYVRKDGSRVPILLGGVMFEGSQNQGISFVVDLTEQKRAEQEREILLANAQEARTLAECANRTKDEFLAIVSHELRSPLNSILGWTKLLRSRKFDPARVDHALETIERNAQAQANLIEDLLDMSRILRGQLSLETAAVDLAPIINVVIANGQLAATAKQIQLRASIAPSVGRVLGDPNRLQQVITNLVTNAIKFTPSGGQVDVSLDQIDQQAIVRVKDTGQGISAEFLPRVFERFQQAENSTTRAKDGLGLGLAIVRHLVELLGGTVAVESPGLGQGATFTVMIPLMEESIQPEIVEQTDQQIDFNQLKILVVDDVPDTCEYLKFALTEMGATVAVATSAAQGYALFQEFMPDLILSDIGMPEEDGYSLLQRIRQLSIGTTVSAIALTAFAKPEDRDRALAAGFQAHLPKPVDPDDLMRLIANILN